MSSLLPIASSESTAAEPPRALQRDLKTLALFISLYCQGNHADSAKAAAAL